MSVAAKRPPWRPRSAEHGSRGRYVRGCRCDDCTAANRIYQRRWYRSTSSKRPSFYLEVARELYRRRDS